MIHPVCIAFADSPGEIHFILKKGSGLQSGQQAYFACKGQFTWINTDHLKCHLVREVIQKMQYEGGSWSWNWDKQCSKFHNILHVIDEWALADMATRMSNEAHISAFSQDHPQGLQ